MTEKDLFDRTIIYKELSNLINETLADSYFQKCHQLMNENSKLRRRIMQLELEIMDLKKELKE